MKKYLLLLSVITIFFIPTLCFANADADIVTRIVNEFNTQTKSWYKVVQKFALNLFYFVVGFEIIRMGIMGLLTKPDLAEIVKKFTLTILAASFFLAVINNYQEWSAMLINGLYELAGAMTKLETQSSNPFIVGLELLKKINIRIDALDIDEVGLTIALYIASFIILVCFSLITANIIVIKCEAMIATTAALVLVPLGASELFREYGINTIRYILSVAFKLFVLQLIVGIGFDFIEQVKFTTSTMSDISVVLGFVVVLLVISKSLPDTVGSIVNGSHVGSGGGLGGAMKAVGAVALGAVGGAIAGGMMGYRAGKIARADGAKGIKGTAFGAVKAMYHANHQASVRRTSMGTELKDRLQTINDLSKG